ncbi:MAG: AAA family ATPase [Deltaproteobacteria bacterium]|nr:AAA family ATPase [Deltaproteobacteria bacterium]
MDENVVHQLLLNPDIYPEKTGSISFCETHISHLYFTDSHVYKIKKPLNLGFLDFTTLEKRLFFCQEEIRLNRRFCPDTYLDVIPIRAMGKNLHFGGSVGDIVEYAVRMKRLPKERMLDILLEHNDPSLPQEMEHLALFLAAAHQDAPPASEVAPSLCDWTSIRTNWDENFCQSEPFADRTIPVQGLQACREKIESILREKRDLFVRREKEDFVREVHGDLHTEHICLTRPIRVYDCIEFNQRFRISDILSDLAFLLMDLEFRGRRDLARQLLDTYLIHSGPQEGQDILLPFYKIYRAWVRGKVESMAMNQHEPEESAFQTARDLACRYFNLAMGYLCSPFLLITCGLMGTGKSVVSRSLSQATGAILIQSDALRKRLMGLSPETRAEVPFETGIYSPEISAAVYDELIACASEELQKGNSVIVDASFARQKHRQDMEKLAKIHGVDFWLAHVECTKKLQQKRLAQREYEKKDVSDGRLTILADQTARFEDIASTPCTIKVDTALEVEYNTGLILSRMLTGV